MTSSDRAAELIEGLGLQPHPEGGHFREVFLMRGIKNVATEMSLTVLAYNLKRVINILGFARTKEAMRLLSP